VPRMVRMCTAACIPLYQKVVMVYRSLVTIALLLVSSSAQAQSVPLGIQFSFDGDRVDNCPGNCGRGCGGFPSVCGGSQYWTAEIIGPTEELGPSWWEAVCFTGVYLDNVRISYSRAWTRYTYFGLTSDGCRAHDEVCRSTPDPTWCWLTAPLGTVCTDAHTKTWTYDGWSYGYLIYDSYELTGEQCFIPPR